MQRGKFSQSALVCFDEIIIHFLQGFVLKSSLVNAVLQLKKFVLSGAEVNYFLTEFNGHRIVVFLQLLILMSNVMQLLIIGLDEVAHLQLLFFSQFFQTLYFPLIALFRNHFVG